MNILDKNGMSPLYYAIHNNNKEMIDWYLSLGSDIN